MSGRPAKRSANDDGGVDDEGLVAQCPGQTRPDCSHRERFSAVVKKNMQSYSRTGQACDRCKVRKIKCDKSPEACSQCANSQHKCYVTDRITGRTELRGYLPHLEREVHDMQLHIRDLNRLCAERGVEVKPWQPKVQLSELDGEVNQQTGDVNDLPDANSPQQTPEATMDADEPSDGSGTPPSSEPWKRFRSLWIRDKPQPKSACGVATYSTRGKWQPRPEQALWEWIGEEAPLSSLKGTLALLGKFFESAPFDTLDGSEPGAEVDSSVSLVNKSVEAFLRSSIGDNSKFKVDLPSRENAAVYTQWYFHSVAPSMPLLHKPTFLQLLAKFYDVADFKPSVPEQVMVHTVFATILLQTAIRHGERLERNEFNDLSSKHYHFALSKLHEVLSSRTFEAFQALALLAYHTRYLPKPGCGSFMANMALHRALELNLHRNCKRPGEPTTLQNELRKRAWWCMLSIVVTMNSKRGYPIPISVQDFDVRLPEPIPDELLSDQGVDTSRTLSCPFEVAICQFKLLPTVMEMHTHVCSLRTDKGNHKVILAALENQMEEWEAELPDSMRPSAPPTQQQDLVGPLLVRTFALELRLQMRHPCLAMMNDKDMIAENTRICEDAAREYLQIVERLNMMKALDVTWYQLSVYWLSILSLLVPQWVRRSEVTPVELTKLEAQMDRSMNTVERMGTVLGCGTEMTSKIAAIINRTLACIRHAMQNSQQVQSLHGPAESKQETQQALPSSAAQTAGEQQVMGQARSFIEVSRQQASISPADGGDPTGPFYTTNDAAEPSPSNYVPLAYANHHPPPGSNLPGSFSNDSSAIYFSASSAPQHHADPTQLQYGQPHGPHQQSDMYWRNGWRNWGAAIANERVRFGAGSLMMADIDNPGRGPVAASIVTENGMSSAASGELPVMSQAAPWDFEDICASGMSSALER